MFSFFKSGFFRIFFSLGFLIVVSQVFGQVQHINFRHYSLADGLSSYKVVKVLQDRFGFMWFATQDGLNKFDGKDIIIYNKSAREKHLLLGSDITDMLEDTSRSMLWVTTSYGGLNGINLTTGNVEVSVAVGDSSNKFSNPWLRTLIQNGDELWIGAYNGISVYSISEKKIIKLLKAPVTGIDFTPKEYDINLFYKDEFERIWAFSNCGITVYSKKDFSVITTRTLGDVGLPEEYEYMRFNNCVILNPGEILLATHRGIKSIRYDKSGSITITEESLPGTENRVINCLNLDHQRNIWYATNEGLYKKNIRDGSITEIEDVNVVDKKKWTNSVYKIFFDNHNNIWLGALQGVALAIRTHSPFLRYFQSEDLKTKISRAKFIFPYNDSVEYVCGYDGFYRVDNNQKSITKLKDGSFLIMFRHTDSRLILNMNKRTYLFTPPDKFIPVEKIYPELAPVSNESFNSAVYWNDSLLFLGSEDGKGVFVWDYRKRKVIKTDSIARLPLKDSIVNTVYKDNLNRIWILGDKSFAILNPANHDLENYNLVNPETNQQLNLFFDVCEANGYYWLASYGSGIIQLDKQLNIKKIISTNDGMTNAGVYKVFPVNDTLLLATSNKGLSRINIRFFSVSNYFESDGLHSNAFEEACGTVYKGKIYAGGPDGFTIIDPEYISANSTPPELYINNIVIETNVGRQEITNQYLPAATLPRNLLQATLYFSALNYSNPELTTYAYRIKGQQDEWIKLGNQNFVNLIGLPPGLYALQVKAYNEDGITSAEKEIQLTILPKWYQTIWFKIGMVLLALGIIYGLYKNRINRLNKEKEIRTHLASDLHDDLGSTLNSVKIYASMALMEKENQAYLERIKESTFEAIAGIRDIIWVLDDKKDLLDHLLTRVESFAAPLCEAHRILFQREVSDSLLSYKLGKEEKRNVFMIIKEAINNSIKYADAGTISVVIGKKGNNLSIRITDNGSGFEIEKITEGNGLRNIFRRAAEIGYHAEIISSAGNGTTVHLEKK